ncbi:type VII secretion protein EccB [Hamadaea tsunoensis]|uniref:type VII secretion protein EccB n=1 Tax=Hamadaea tsunoensis TaxID=53368 RepID=UPI000426B81C|nr:type VII secretion protein EccB [Hamadaea tsunoensis]
MPSRQDQLQSYQFSVQRVVSALVLRETDPTQSPFRRVTVAGFASLMVGVVLIAGFGVYALFTGGATDSWKTQTGAVLQDESGAHFVYQDNVLHPTRNLASALLFAGGSTRNIVKVSSNSLAKVPRGALVGIADAPDSIPAADKLVTGAWTVCDIPAGQDAAPEEGGRRTLLVVGDMLGVSKGGTALKDDTGLVVTVPGSADAWLLWRQRKFLIKNVNKDTLVAIGFALEPTKLPVVDRAFLNAFESGEPIQAPPVGEVGTQSPVSGYKVGQVLRNRSSSGDRFFVATSTGLKEITQVQASLLAPRVEPANANQITGNPSTELIPQGDDAPPAVKLTPTDEGDGGLCATASNENGFSTVRYGVPVPDVTGVLRTAGKSSRGTPIADYVVVQSGGGVLVEGYTFAKTSSGVVSIVTDVGQQFPIADDAAMGALGYAGVDRTRMPVSLVALLPQGPQLNRTDAGAAMTLG